MSEPARVDLANAIDDTEFAWSLCLIGEDQSSKLAVLTGDLAARRNKQITSGFAYWGIGPTIAWDAACRDPFYPVMKQSIESFQRRWRTVWPKVKRDNLHYVSLGVGTGGKDRQIVETLHQHHPGSFYVPVDMSSEMLRLGTKESTAGTKISRQQIVPVQLDFSIPQNLVELRRLLDKIVGAEPILFSLLGNTMANFADDSGLLASLAGLLRPQDTFLIEVATTNAITEDLAAAAADEYARSRAYREFVTSALLHYTDITINMDHVQFRGGAERDHALLVKVLYQNLTGMDAQLMLPDRSRVTFPDRDTIQLYLTRKYARPGLDAVIRDCALTKLAAARSDFTAQRSSAAFGMDLLLVAANQDARPEPTSVADAVWS